LCIKNKVKSQKLKVLRKDSKTFGEKFKERIYNWILRLVKLIETLNKHDTLCRIASEQLIRSGTSIGANYFEATSGSSKKDFTNFLSHSLKSANESKFWLSLLRDTDRSNKEETVAISKELWEISNILASSIKALRG